MEEILASIRRIISEDEPQPSAEPEPAATPEPPLASESLAPEPEAAPAFEPEPEPELEAEDDEVLELTEPVETAASSIGDLDVYEAPSFEPEPAPPPRPAPVYSAPPPAEDSLVSESIAASAASVFSQLSQRISMPPPSQTLDDVVRELLKPMLKDWLDRNLPAIVQAKVEEEVERIARRRMS